MPIKIGSITTIVFSSLLIIIVLECMGRLITNSSITFYGNILFWVFAGSLIGMGICKVAGMWVQDVMVPLKEIEGMKPASRARLPRTTVERKSAE